MNARMIRSRCLILILSISAPAAFAEVTTDQGLSRATKACEDAQKKEKTVKGLYKAAADRATDQLRRYKEGQRPSAREIIAPVARLAHQLKSLTEARKNACKDSETVTAAYDKKRDDIITISWHGCIGQDFVAARAMEMEDAFIAARALACLNNGNDPAPTFVYKGRKYITRTGRAAR